MRSDFVILTAIFISLMPLIPFNCAKMPQKYYRLKCLWVQNRNNIVPNDFNGDRVDELLVQSGIQLDVISQEEQAYYHSFRMDQYPEFSAFPLPGANLDSITIINMYDDEQQRTIDLMAYMRGKQESRYEWNLFRFPRPNARAREGYEQGIVPIGMFKSQGRPLLLFRLSTAYNLEFDRGLLAYDLKARREVWRFRTAPQLVSWQFVDIDDDGNDEIILGSYAPSNMFRVNGTSDDSSYVFVLDDDGSLLWRKSLGGEYTEVRSFVGHFGNSGRQICLFINDSSDKAVQNKLLLLDPLNGRVNKGPLFVGRKSQFIFDVSFTMCTDIDGDGIDEIAFGNSDGRVRIIDQRLQTKYISKSYGSGIRVDFIVDLNNDGLKEIVCIMKQQELVILNYRLEEMTTYPLELQLDHYEAPVRGGGFYRILLRSVSEDIKNKPINTWRLLELDESLIPFEGYTGAAKYFWWGLGVIIVIAVWWAAFRGRKKMLHKLYIHLLMRDRSFDKSLLINREQVIIAAGRLWEDLIPSRSTPLMGAKLSASSLPSTIQINLLKNLEKKDKTIPKFVIETGGSSLPVALEIEYIKVLSIYRVSLRYLNEENLIKNIKRWSDVAQKLAHGIKNPLTAIKLNSEELEYRLQKTQCRDEQVHEHLYSIASQIDKLRRMADGFMRFVEFEELNLMQTDINQFIEQFVAQERDNVPPHILISLELDQILPYVFIDQLQFKYALANVFYNALQSISDHGTVLISTHFVQLFDAQLGVSNDFIELRIQDNGIGIAADALERVVKPYYTTKKEGTGLGLSIVVKIIEMHEGQFDISSRQGEGTTVTFRLKAAD